MAKYLAVGLDQGGEVVEETDRRSTKTEAIETPHPCKRPSGP
jgi:hypothetical protein